MKDVETVLSQLTQSDKIALLAGADFWHTAALPKHDVPALRMSDGPNGVRGTKFFNGKGASCFPCGTGLAASFDVELMRRVGEALGDEARAKGVHIVLGALLRQEASTSQSSACVQGRRSTLCARRLVAARSRATPRTRTSLA